MNIIEITRSGRIDVGFTGADCLVGPAGDAFTPNFAVVKLIDGEVSEVDLYGPWLDRRQSRDGAHGWVSLTASQLHPRDAEAYPAVALARTILSALGVDIDHVGA